MLSCPVPLAFAMRLNARERGWVDWLPIVVIISIINTCCLPFSRGTSFANPILARYNGFNITMALLTTSKSLLQPSMCLLPELSEINSASYYEVKCLLASLTNELFVNDARRHFTSFVNDARKHFHPKWDYSTCTITSINPGYPGREFCEGCHKWRTASESVVWHQIQIAAAQQSSEISVPLTELRMNMASTYL